MPEVSLVPADLDGCASEPIHIPGSIQPHGYLFVLDNVDLTVVAASKNAADALGLTPGALIGRPIADLLVAATTEGLEAALRSQDGEASIRVRFLQSMQSADWDALVHDSNGLKLLELGSPIVADRAETLFSQVARAIERIRASESAERACNILAAEIRQLTEFDRVLVYRFNADWNGEVIAEDKVAAAASYRGHAFPASDIPAQARALYARNTKRLIPDARYTPSPIIPAILPSTGLPIDLSSVWLRSVSPVHLEYLANMGVVGSMSVSIMRDGRLWGLVACHHSSPRSLPYRVLQGCELLAQSIAWYLDALERNAAAECVVAVRRVEAQLTAQADRDSDYRDRLKLVAPALLGLTQSQGLAICDDQMAWTVGAVPTDEQIQALARWLRLKGGERLVTDRLSASFPAASAFGGAAGGIAALKLANGWLIWFRAEWQHTLTWAGEPGKPAVAAATGGRIDPRKSFASWRKKIRGQSRPWTAPDLFTVEEIQMLVLRTMMTDHIRRLAASQQALVAAKSRAEEASYAKSQFLAMMSHEVRTPLNGIIGFADLLAEADLPAAEREQAQFIRDAGDVLLVIINDILDFSKIEAGKVSLECIELSLLQTLRSCVALYDASARAKGLTIELNTVPGLPERVLGDPTRLRQVLTNLLNNAVKFSARGRITLRVAEAGRELIRFEVADTGIGIAPEKQAGIFEQFAQADTSTTRHYGGTGLGLAICRRLVGLMGGEIGMDSRLGQGSTFWFTANLPATGSPQHEAAAPHAASPEASSLRLRVLVAEDTYVNQELARILLQREGHEVTVVADGLAAVAAAQRDLFDLILMDMQMPNLDGLDATRAIRALPEPAGSVPIIALTASAFADEINQCRAAGMNGHLAKPIVKAALYEILRTFAAGR